KVLENSFSIPDTQIDERVSNVWQRTGSNRFFIKTKPIYVLALAGLVAGCATDSSESWWRDAKFSSPPCRQPEHEHETTARNLNDLTAVGLNLGKYRSVQSRPG